VHAEDRRGADGHAAGRDRLGVAVHGIHRGAKNRELLMELERPKDLRRIQQELNSVTAINSNI
jgi:hypothetical protein